MDFQEFVRRLQLLPWEAPSLRKEYWGQARLLAWTWLQHLVGFVRARHRLVRHPTQPDSRATMGFVPLRPADLEVGRLRASREAFLAAPDSMAAHNAAIARDFDLRMTLADPTVKWNCEGRVRPILDQMQALLTRCEAEDIRLIFSFQKLWEGNGCVYFEAVERWGPCTVIQTMGHEAAPDLYDPEDAYDAGHFLESGARKFSRALGDQLEATMARCDLP